MYAAISGDDKIVPLLIENGADMDLKSKINVVSIVNIMINNI